MTMPPSPSGARNAPSSSDWTYQQGRQSMSGPLGRLGDFHRAQADDLSFLGLAIGDDFEFRIAVDGKRQVLELVVFVAGAEVVFDGGEALAHALGVVQIGLHVNLGAVIGLAAFKLPLAALDALNGDA